MRKLIVALLFLFAATLNAQTADQLWADLMAGNQLFVSGQVVYGSLPSARKMWATTQTPPVAILACADSRVPAEIVFGRTVGELFVVRVAGNVQDQFGIASLEYAVQYLGTKMVVVMGHTDCGAVKASLATWEQGKPTQALWELIQRLREAYPLPKPPYPNLETATLLNINYSASQLRKSAVIDRVTVTKALYNVATGKVERIP